MKIAELRQEPHLSVSGINDYTECGLLYRFTRIDKLKPEFRSDAMEFGSSIHKVLADFYQERMVGNPLSLQQLQESFERYWTAAAKGEPPIQYKEGKTFQTLLREGKDLLAAYHEAMPGDEFTILAIEEPFRFTIESLPVPMIGVFDLLEEDESGTIIITDWKTSSRAYSADDVDGSFQLTVYDLAAHMNGYGNREILLRFGCLIKTKKPKFDQYYTVRTEAERRRAVRKIQQVWDAISKNVFIPNDSSWKCKGCSYKKHCIEWFGN